MRLRLLRALFLLLVAAAAGAVGCGSSSPSRRAVIVDTDMSSDDVIALLYLLEDKGVDVRAVTVAGTGLVHRPQGGRNALELLALAGRTDVPVACGRGEPLAGLNAVPTAGARLPTRSSASRCRPPELKGRAGTRLPF